MTFDLVEHYRSEVDRAGDVLSRFVYITVEIRRPLRVEYMIGSWGDKSELPEGEAEQWRASGNLDETFTFEGAGRVIAPDDCADYTSTIQINSLGSIFQHEHLPHGNIGDGWLKDRHFLFRVYVPCASSRNIIDAMRHYAVSDDSQNITVRVDLTKVEYRPRPDWVSYQIVRLYI